MVLIPPQIAVRYTASGLCGQLDRSVSTTMLEYIGITSTRVMMSSGASGWRVATSKVLVNLIHGHPLNAIVGIDPVDEAFVHSQHLGSS